MSDSKDKKLVGRREPPTCEHATSVYEPRALVRPGVAASLYDVVIDDGEDDEVADLVQPPAPVATASGRTVPVVRRGARAPSAAPEHLDPPIEVSVVPVRSEQWTIDEAQPLPDAPPRKATAEIVAPEAGHKVRVTIQHFGPANDEERAWVVNGDPGVSIVVHRTGSPPRRITLYVAFLITAYSVDERGNRTVAGIVRWYGLPSDREGTWGRKLMQDDRECYNSLVRSLERFLAVPDLRVGAAFQFIANPKLSLPRAQGATGNEDDGNVKDPVVKARINLIVANAQATAAKDFYELVIFPWFHVFLQAKWPFFSREAWDRYWHGRRVARGEVETFGQGDGLTPTRRIAFLKAAGKEATGFMGQLFRAAYMEDQEVLDALTRAQAPSIHGTVIGSRSDE